MSSWFSCASSHALLPIVPVSLTEMNGWILLFPVLYCIVFFNIQCHFQFLCLCLYSSLLFSYYPWHASMKLLLFSSSFFFEWVSKIFPPWFHPLFTWCLGQSAHSENLVSNLQQSWVILTLSCHSTDLNFTACTFYNTKCVSHFEGFLLLQLDYLNLDPHVLQWPAASMSFAPSLYITFLLREKRAILLSYHHLLMRYCDWFETGNLLKETFGRWTWNWKCPFPTVLKLCQSGHLSISVCFHGGAQLCPF